MARPGRTQKQIAERYKGNLGYYRRLHPWRRTRLMVSLITIFGGLLAIFLFRYYGRETFFNAGEIATAHSKFANDCAKCHVGLWQCEWIDDARFRSKDFFAGEWNERHGGNDRSDRRSHS